MPITLTPFHASRYQDPRRIFQRPVSLGEWTYATNGFIAVRVPRRADIPEPDPDPRNPNLSGMAYWREFGSADFPPHPGFPEFDCVPCHHCDEGAVYDCYECEGTGELTLHSPYRAYNQIHCESCDGGGYLAKSQIPARLFRPDAAAETCPACCGAGQVQRDAMCPTPFGPGRYMRRLLYAIHQLPELRVTFHERASGPPILLFRFTDDGRPGEGVLMPFG
jgi:hypothetical protein